MQFPKRGADYEAALGDFSHSFFPSSPVPVHTAAPKATADPGDSRQTPGRGDEDPDHHTYCSASHLYPQSLDKPLAFNSHDGNTCRR